MAKCQTEVSADGFESIRLFNANISVSVLPQLGGKIYDIVDLKTGQDWLWKNPHIALRHPLPEMDYEKELDSGGWDEILFSVKPCTVTQSLNTPITISDHGTLVDKVWKLVRTNANASGEAICELYAEGQSPHFRLDRKIIIDADLAQMRLEYRLINTGQDAWPWFWCPHPLLAIEDGMQIKLEHGQPIRPVRNGLTDPVSNADWPTITSLDGEQIDLQSIFEENVLPKNYCEKLFVQSTGHVCVSTADGNESLHMHYDPEILPWLGLWINKKGWSGCDSQPYLNLGVEPATAPHDKLSDAVANDQARQLQPDESITWSLLINLENSLNT